MAHDVFISYASQDKPAADAACATLEAHGIRCWIAPRDILAGTGWGEAIVNAIHQSQVMVLVFSSHANESPHIRREVDRAVTKGVPIIPVRIEDVVPVKALEYYMSSVHWLDALTPPLEAHLNLLADKVHVLLRKQAEERPHPVPPSPPPAPPVKKDTTLGPTRLPVWALAAAAVVAAVIGTALWMKPWSPSSLAPPSTVPGQPEVTTHDNPAPQPLDATEPQQLQRLVSQRLQKEGFNLKVDVNPDRIVTLTGIVRNQEQKALAMNVARVPGVKDVRPQINVQEKWQLQ
jgi:hypothetical protein